MFLVSCVPSPVSPVAPLLTPMPTSTLAPTSFPSLQLSQLSLQKIESPMVTVDFGNITALDGEYIIFKDGSEQTPDSYKYRNYRYQAWNDPKQQGKLFDIRDITATRSIYISALKIIHFDNQLNFWLATELLDNGKPYSSTLHRDQLFKINMQQRKLEQYSFESPCLVNINGERKIAGRTFLKRLALDYLVVFVYDCPAGEQNGVALFSLSRKAITHFFPLGSSQYPAPYKETEWLTPEVLAFVSETDTCVLKLSGLASDCRKFAYTTLTLPGVSPDGTWFLTKGKTFWELRPLACTDREYILCDPSALDPTRTTVDTHIPQSKEEKTHWSPDSSRFALVNIPPFEVTLRAGVIWGSSITVYDLPSQRETWAVSRDMAFHLIQDLIWSLDGSKFLIKYGGKQFIDISAWREKTHVETEGSFEDVFFVP